MKSTKSSLVLLSKKSAICDKLVNASNLKPLHGLSLKLSEFQVYFQDLTVFFILLQFTFVAYGRWNARGFVNLLSKDLQVQSEVNRLASVLWIVC